MRGVKPGLLSLYLKKVLLGEGLILRKGVLGDKGGREPMQDDSNILAYLSYACRADVIALSLQKLETWLIQMVNSTDFTIKLPECESGLPTIYWPCDIGHVSFNLYNNSRVQVLFSALVCM